MHEGNISPLHCLQSVAHDMSRCLGGTCFYFLFLGQLMASCHGHVKSFTISNLLNRKPLELGPAHLGHLRAGPRPQGWDKTPAIIASSLLHTGLEEEKTIPILKKNTDECHPVTECPCTWRDSYVEHP